ncbi:cysteine proteinase [Pyrenochaeta sp. DS3sAY3a]|nr:cysteine proteinase [Pyrenochaeta sp. DS3sAY3a]
MQRGPGMMGSIFGLNPGALLQKGVRGVAGALSMGPSDVPPGLGNISMSCYQNSVIQGLASLPSLHDYLAKVISEHTSLTSDSTNDALFEMISKLNNPDNRGQNFWIRGKLKSMSVFQQQDAQEYYSKVLDALDEEVKKAASSKRRSSVSWVEATKSLADPPVAGSDQDNAATEEGSKVSPPSEQPFVQPNPLDGLLAQRVGCVACGYSEGLSLIPFNCVTVSLGTSFQYDIHERLDDYTMLEYIDGVECAKCTLLKLKNTLTPLASQKPGTQFETKLNAVLEVLDEEDFEDKTLIKKLNIPKKNWIQSRKSKQVVVARAPKSLVLHVNRSSFNEMTGESYKNSAYVSYPKVLDFGNWCLGNQPSGSQHPDISMEEWPRDPGESMLPQREDEEMSTSQFQYRLRAAVTHYGTHGNGHYVCYRPHPGLTRPTKEIDDKDEEQESEEAQKEQWWRFSDDSVRPVQEGEAHQGNVFMLFYERMDTISSSTQRQDAIVENITIPEDAPLPPVDVAIDTRAFTDEAAEIPLPDDEDDLSDSTIADDSIIQPPQPLIANDDIVPNAYPTPPPSDAASPPNTDDQDTEVSDTESDSAPPSTQSTSLYDSETDKPAPPTPKLPPLSPISPHLMRTAGKKASRNAGNRQSLPLVSAT